ncbi:Carnosine synthase 1 [Perkinsus chesapeaki]|uniref:Carnosine synthase 1 n=1 Tax=Perkinsus chesapeaki TaxID=330153 RepID=A0A7J6MAF8_PERCH|nr:Carnosine synthase 1 [Perkinsus chesapeaki]
MGEPRLEPVRGSEVIIADDGYKLFLRNWRDPGRSSGKGIIVFLVHGMAEHSERYDELAGGLVSALPSGSIVYAHDQRGHERTAAELGGGLASLGEVSCPQSSDPISVLAGDLVLLVKTKVPADTEYCLVGHSMGSIIVRLALVELVKQVTQYDNDSDNSEAASRGVKANEVISLDMVLEEYLDGDEVDIDVIMDGAHEAKCAVAYGFALNKKSGVVKNIDFIERHMDSPKIIELQPLVKGGEHIVGPQEGMPTWLAEIVVEDKTSEKAKDECQRLMEVIADECADSLM